MPLSDEQYTDLINQLEYEFDHDPLVDMIFTSLQQRGIELVKTNYKSSQRHLSTLGKQE